MSAIDEFDDIRKLTATDWASAESLHAARRHYADSHAWLRALKVGVLFEEPPIHSIIEQHDPLLLKVAQADLTPAQWQKALLADSMSESAIY